MPIIRSQEIHCREDLPQLCNWRNLYQGAVEIGVDRGEYSQLFLSRWYGGDYFGVDTYEYYENWVGAREADLHVAAMRYERYATRARLVKISAHEFAAKQTRTFDFVYVDGAHDYESVMQDLTDYWPLVSDVGIIAGHDYDETHPGVMRAVDEFFEGKEVYLTHEKDIPSWYVYKSGIPGPDWRRLP